MTENAQAGASTPPKIHNGTYTIAHETRGHFTLKLHTAQEGQLAGRRILSLLVGPDNVTNFAGVAFWEDERTTAHVWKRYASNRDARAFPIDGYHFGQHWSPVEQKLAIWADLVVRGYGYTTNGVALRGDRSSYWTAEGYTLLLEGRCVCCNRKLTDPDSIRLGIGPVCGGRA